MNMPTEEELIKEECLELFKKIVKSIPFEDWGVENVREGAAGRKFSVETSYKNFLIEVFINVSGNVTAWFRCYDREKLEILISTAALTDYTPIKPEDTFWMLECFLRGLKYDR